MTIGIGILLFLALGTFLEIVLETLVPERVLDAFLWVLKIGAVVAVFVLLLMG